MTSVVDSIDNKFILHYINKDIYIHTILIYINI